MGLINEPDSILKNSARNVFNCILATVTPENHLPAGICLETALKLFLSVHPFPESLTHLLSFTSTNHSLKYSPSAGPDHLMSSNVH